MLGGLVSSASFAATTTTYPPYAAEPGGRPETVTLDTRPLTGDLRRFTLASTAPQRENGPDRRVIDERADAPRVVSGSAMFDALFAQAVDDARLDSVETIRDPAYDDDRPIACGCFQTGEKWPYVWTRDLSYALDLGLAAYDPRRGAAALAFKTSGLRPGVAVPPELPAGSMQIVQDTGTGGSWPVSTDRVAWALGAEATLAALDGPARAAFARRAYAALRGTIEADRLAAFDPATGLYGGEHSFLDWREQTYAPWIVDHFELMAQGKALSTNILHYRALRLAARLAREAGEGGVAARYTSWADALGPTIDRAFWDARAGLYVSLLSADPTPIRIGRYDLLGNALAILSGIVPPARAKAVSANYPQAPFGPPVYWPEQPGVPVYHNRAIWPFVTAYALRAAAATGNAAAVDRAIASLMRGAALNLSNMENFEWLSGKADHDGGPQVDSRRQLWSVGAYLGMVEQVVFGWRPGLDGVKVAPLLTSATRRLLGSAPVARLEGLRWHGRTVAIELALPPEAPDGMVYAIARVTLNGRVLRGPITDALLSAPRNRIAVAFEPARAGGGGVPIVPGVSSLDHDDPRVFAPAVPVIEGVRRSGGTVRIVLARNDSARPVRLRLYRDGRDIGIASGVDGIDPAPAAPALTACYTAVAEDLGGTGLRSHPTPPMCLPGALAQEIVVTDRRVHASAGVAPPGDGVAVSTARAGSGDAFAVSDIRIAAPGHYAIRLRYDNHRYQLNTGITNAVKRLTVTDAAGRITMRIVQLPHVSPAGDLHPIATSTAAWLDLAPGTYRIALSDFLNMSALAANARYAHAGGVDGPVNEARIAAIQIDAVAPPSVANSPPR